MSTYKLSFSFNNTYIDVSLNNYEFNSIETYGFITTKSITFVGDDDTVRSGIRKVLDKLLIRVDNQKFKLFSDINDRFNKLLDSGNMDIDIKDTIQQNWAKFFNIKLYQLKTPKVAKQYCIDGETFKSMRDELTASMYSLSNLQNILTSSEEQTPLSNVLIAKKIYEIWQRLNNNVINVLEEE